MKDIHEVIVLKTDATLTQDVVQEIYDDHYDELPDDECFIRDLIDNPDEEDEYAEQECSQCQTSNDYDAKFCKECGTKLEDDKSDPDALGLNMRWNGEESGKSWQSIFVKKIVPHIKGRAELLLLLETADDQPYKLMGVLIDNGTYNSFDVDVKFVPWSNSED